MLPTRASPAADPCIRIRVTADRSASAPETPARDEIQAHRTVCAGAWLCSSANLGPAREREESVVDEETFNLSVRKFLKTLGVTAQREIELGVREQLRTGALRGDE